MWRVCQRHVVRKYRRGDGSVEGRGPLQNNSHHKDEQGTQAERTNMAALGTDSWQK